MLLLELGTKLDEWLDLETDLEVLLIILVIAGLCVFSLPILLFLELGFFLFLLFFVTLRYLD